MDDATDEALAWRVERGEREDGWIGVKRRLTPSPSRNESSTSDGAGASGSTEFLNNGPEASSHSLPSLTTHKEYASCAAQRSLAQLRRPPQGKGADSGKILS
jgi:hypothetical protein